jgi:hypothetical protein
MGRKAKQTYKKKPAKGFKSSAIDKPIHRKMCMLENYLHRQINAARIRLHPIRQGVQIAIGREMNL